MARECTEEKNKKRCNCSYPNCPRHGICCECLHYHLRNKELPACCFPNDVERTWDRSFGRFIETWRGRV